MADSVPVNRKLKIAICHPDLGIGGAERLIVDAAVELASRGHEVHVFTAHHDRGRCFEETVDESFPVTVYGSFLPRHIFYRFHAICSYIRCIFVAICMVLLWPSFDVVLTDQVSAVIPVLKLKSSKVIFYCHFPDLLLAQHTTMLRRLYRMPIDMLEEASTGMADLILVNSKFTASVFAKTFKSLHAKGINPSVLYPAVNVDQFGPPRAYLPKFLSINRFERKKNIELAILAFAMVMSKKAPKGILEQIPDGEMDVSLVIAVTSWLLPNLYDFGAPLIFAVEEFLPLLFWLHSLAVSTSFRGGLYFGFSAGGLVAWQKQNLGFPFYLYKSRQTKILEIGKSLLSDPVEFYFQICSSYVYDLTFNRLLLFTCSLELSAVYFIGK